MKICQPLLARDHQAARIIIEICQSVVFQSCFRVFSIQMPVCQSGILSNLVYYLSWVQPTSVTELSIGAQEARSNPTLCMFPHAGIPSDSPAKSLNFKPVSMTSKIIKVLPKATNKTSNIHPNISRIPTSVKSCFLQPLCSQMLVYKNPDAAESDNKYFIKVTWKHTSNNKNYVSPRCPKG